MRAWILDNGMLDHTGHHFNNTSGLRDECTRRGVQTRVLVHREAQPALVATLGAQPVFDFGPYDLASTDPLSGPIENLIVQGRSFAEGLVRYKAEIAPDDLLLVPSALQNEVYGCALGLAQLPPERRPRLVLNFIVENFFTTGTRTLGLGASLYRFAAQQLARALPDERLLLTADGTAMAQWYTRVLGRPVGDFPIPKLYLPESPVRTADDGVPRIAILGHSRAEKGFALVPELVARHPQLRFLIHVCPAGAESMWEGAAGRVDAAPNTELVRGALDPLAYHALLLRADIVLLPYDSSLMSLRSSGVFAEAVAAGKITVVPGDTWMSAHLEEGHGAGVVFETFTVDAISAALSEAVARLPELNARGRACAPAWRADQSTSAYMERVVNYFGMSPHARN